MCTMGNLLSDATDTPLVSFNFACCSSNIVQEEDCKDGSKEASDPSNDTGESIHKKSLRLLRECLTFCCSSKENTPQGKESNDNQMVE